MRLQQPGERIQAGTFMICFGKPAPKVNGKIGSSFSWAKQRTPWAVSKTCQSTFKETGKSIVSQAPKAKIRE